MDGTVDCSFFFLFLLFQSVRAYGIQLSGTLRVVTVRAPRVARFDGQQFDFFFPHGKFRHDSGIRVCRKTPDKLAGWRPRSGKTDNRAAKGSRPNRKTLPPFFRRSRNFRDQLSRANVPLKVLLALCDRRGRSTSVPLPSLLPSPVYLKGAYKRAGPKRISNADAGRGSEIQSTPTTPKLNI